MQFLPLVAPNAPIKKQTARTRTMSSLDISCARGNRLDIFSFVQGLTEYRRAPQKRVRLNKTVLLTQYCLIIMYGYCEIP